MTRVNTHGCNRRKRGKLAQGEKKIQKRSEERGRKKRKDTTTEKAKFNTIVCWQETKKPKPISTVVQLTTCDSITVCIQRAASSTRDGGVGRERVSGKSGNAQSDVRAVQSKNERREVKQKGNSARERACVWHGCTNTVAKGEGEGEAS